MFRSIRWRIAIPYVLLALATMLGMLVYVSLTTRQASIASLRTELTREASLVAELVAPLLKDASRSGPLDAFAQRQADALGRRVTIIGVDGVVLGESQRDSASLENHFGRSEVQQALALGRGSAIRFSETLRQEMLYAAVAVAATGQPLAVVRLAVPLAEIDEQTARQNRALAGGVIVSLLLIVALAILIAGRTAGPVRQLTTAVRQMAQGDLDVRIAPTTRDEVGQLADAFNEMAAAFQSQIHIVVDQRNKLGAVLTHMTDGAIIVDQEGRVQLMNPAAAHFLGVSADGATGQSLVAVARDHQVVAVWQRCRQMAKEQSDLVEVTGRGPFLRVVATPLQEPSGMGALLIMQDLTQVRRLETIRRDFISNISHELRNPLAALKALVETLRDGAIDDRPAAERFLTQMDAEVDSMTQMVRELLELSRIESGRVPLHLAPASVADLVTQAVERLRSQAERAGLLISVELPGSLPRVMADTERLQQVLNNLIHNAIKFTPPGGKITISAEAGSRVTIVVRDTGVGIAAADLPRIFERFYKADRARSSGGTGLGLAIAKHIVQAHGGQIWAESVEGQGATFRFTLSKA